MDEKKLDILLVTDNCLETVGGEQESTKIILEGVGENYSIGVIQPGEIDHPIKGVKYYYITKKTRIKHFIKKPFYFMKYVWNVRKIITTEKPKIIHTQAQVSFFIVSLLKTLKLIPKESKVIHTERGLYIRYNSFFKKIFLFFMRKLDVLVTTTNYNMNFWKKALEKSHSHLEYKVIENTAGELFETYDERKEKTNNDYITIGFAGRYSEQKNWPLAIDISKQLKEKLSDKVYIKMAVGCLDEPSEVETKKMFKELQICLGENFEGKINIELKEMDDFYYSIDVFVMTSLKDSESFGRTLVEAMSRNIVVLTTDAGGPVEIVNDEGKIFESAKDFTEKISLYYSNQQEMINVKKENFKKVKEKYSLKNNIDKHFKLYKEMIKF